MCSPLRLPLFKKKTGADIPDAFELLASNYLVMSPWTSSMLLVAHIVEGG
jgi:hypothetical protein